jgi:3-oxoacyl-[acyl-carrier protein] reductase
VQTPTDAKPAVPWHPRVDLTDQRILVFGGAGALAEVFAYAAASCGARLALVDVAGMDKLARIAGGVGLVGPEVSAVALQADITNVEDAGTALDYAWERLGGVDTAVDFAGVHHRPFHLAAEDVKATIDDFRRVLEVNLSGAYVVTALCARTMARQGTGHILHLCSNGSRASLYGSYGYNASKHGLEGLVKTAAAQLAPFGVRVNGVAPGTVETPLNRSLLRNEDGSFKPRALSILAHTPTKRFASREGVAESLVTLCVPQRHLTGNVVFVDDGYNVEGHSWPDGNLALYDGPEALAALLEDPLGRTQRNEEA